MRKVLVTIPVNDRHKEYLEHIGKDCEFCYVPAARVTGEDVAQAQIIIGNVPPKMIQESPRLQWIQLNSAGSDAYCKPGVLKSGTVLTNATGAYGLAISEYMIGVSIMLQNKLYLYRKNQLEHVWRDEGDVTSIYGSTTLVIGLGDIGGEYAKRMKALGSYIIGVRRTRSEKPDYLDEIYTTDRLDELLPRADFVSLSLPNSPATRHILNEERMRKMKPTAFLINVGRGEAIDTDALCRVLESGHLGGCALDVTDPEPLPADHPLWDAPRTVITPHIAGKFHLQETFERIVRIAGRNLERLLDGRTEEMENLVDFETGYRKRS